MSRKKPATVLQPVNLGRIAQWHILSDGAPAVAAPPSLLGAWSDWARRAEAAASARVPSGRLDWPPPHLAPPDVDHYVLVGVRSLHCSHPRTRPDFDADARECPVCVAASVAEGWTARCDLAASVRWPDDPDVDGDPDDYTAWEAPPAPVALVTQPMEHTPHNSGSYMPEAQARQELATRLEAVLDPMGSGGAVGVRLRDGGPWAALVELVEELERAAAARRRGAA